MKNKIVKNIIGALAIIFALTGCSKNSDELASVQNTKQDILTFANAQAFDSAKVKITSMKPEERVAWEKSNGFKSFGTICDEFYATIEPKSFKTIDDVRNFVTLNNDKIQLQNKPNGDIYCVVQEFDNSDRYLMNQNKMYIVGSTVYKKFDNELVSADIVFKESLQSAKSIDNLSSTIKRSNLSKTNSMNKVTSAIVTFDEINGDVKIGSDNYRLNIKISSSNVGSGGYSYTVHQLNLVNYARWLAVWWARTYNTDYAITLKATDTGYGLITLTDSDNRGIKSETLLNFSGVLGGGPISTNPHLVSYDIYAKNTEKGCLIDAIKTY